MRISDWSSDVCSSDLDAALDVTQQSFIAAFAALGRSDGTRPFRVWMARIAINKCHAWTRRRAVRRLFSFPLPIDAANDVAADAPTLEGFLSERQQINRKMTTNAALHGYLTDQKRTD